MKFLIDTNIFIPIEIVTEDDIEPNTPRVALLSKNIHELGHHLYVHPAQKVDIENDTDDSRKKIRAHKFETYPSLDQPPKTKSDLKESIGSAEVGTNDWVDNKLIAAVHYDAVDFLITEDTGILKKAERLDLRDRIINLDEAIDLIDNLFDNTPTPPPAVEAINAYDLDEDDPIFEGLRNDYEGFDEWLKKCKRQNRPAWIVHFEDEDNYAAICILKKETNNEFGLSGLVYKICTFKVVDRGIKLGELLLKTIFEYANKNNADHMYVEVYTKYEHLIDLFNSFGFYDIERDKYTGELRLVKDFKFTTSEKDSLSPLEFNTKFGPKVLKKKEASVFIIPIVPEYHRLLFPEVETQTKLFAGRNSFGNSIRKAYLCNSNSRLIEPGDILLFYRSRDLQKILVLGVAEKTFVSKKPDEIARFVGKRTVYTYDEIESMCRNSEVLSILFRQVDQFEEGIHLDELKKASILKSAPQSITKVKEEIKEWI